MLDLIKINSPSDICVDGEFFAINTDFRKWLSFARMIAEPSTLLVFFDSFYLDRIPQDRQKGFDELLKFYSPERILPRPIATTSARVLDYELDADLIYAAFMQCYHIDLFATDSNGHAVELHWHRFLALLYGLRDTMLNDVMSYRAWQKGDKTTYEQSMEKLKNAWALPTIQSAEDKAIRDEFNMEFEQ